MANCLEWDDIVWDYYELDIFKMAYIAFEIDQKYDERKV